MKRAIQRNLPFHRRFFSAESGGVMVMSAILFPVIAGAAVFAMDHIIVTEKVASLQRAADSTAIAVAHELPLIKENQGSGNRTLTAVANNYAQRKLPDAMLQTTASREGDNIIGVELTMTVDSPLNQIFGGASKQLSARAKAEAYGGQNICIISTDLSKVDPGVGMDDKAEIKAGNCGIYSNSQEPNSIRVKDSAHIEANFICAAGGYEGSKSGTSTMVTTDCPQIGDPLESRPEPKTRRCSHYARSVIGKDETVNLQPGTYCGGLKIEDNANVWFNPGIYTFKDGPLIIEDEAQAIGTEVGLFFDDSDSYFEFKDNADISFSAPETGDMAGILVGAKKLCDSKRCSTERNFKITSANVRSLLGTIYIPYDDLVIDTTTPISEDAAFTILIVDNLVMKQSPALVLNTNYAATSVPVPDGFVERTKTRLVE